MRISLTNFRCWRDRSFDIPDAGLVLLHGDSGAGKTTILNAIYYALYGVGTRLITTGEKKMSVKFEYLDFKITRSKGPNLLLLSYRGADYIDDVAQEIISGHFGRSFTITSYITQKSVGNFLNLSPNDKMSFLEGLALGDQDIGRIKKSVRERVREKKDTLLGASAGLDLMMADFKLMTPPTVVHWPLDGAYSDIKIKNESIRWKKNTRLLREARLEKDASQQSHIAASVKSALYNKLQLQMASRCDKLESARKIRESIVFDDNIADLKSTLAHLILTSSVQDLRTRYNEDYSAYTELTRLERDRLFESRDRLACEIKATSHDDTNNLRGDAIKSEIAQIISYNQIQSEIDGIQRRIDAIVDYSLISNQIGELQASILSREEEKTGIVQRLDIKCCPQCKTSLRLVSLNLVVASGSPVDERTARSDIASHTATIKRDREKLVQLSRTQITAEELCKSKKLLESKLSGLDCKGRCDTSTLKSDLASHVTGVSKYTQCVAQLKIIKAQLEGDNLSPTIKAMGAALEVRRCALEKSTKLSVEDDIETDYTIDELRDEITQQTLVAGKVRAADTTLNNIQSEIELLTIEISGIDIDSVDYTEKIAALSDSIASLSTINASHNARDVQLKLYASYLERKLDYDDKSNRIAAIQLLETRARQELAYTELFYHKLQDAESAALSQTITNLNYYINYYLCKFFPLEPITIEISPYKTTKKDIKSTIDVVVGYRGTLTDVNSLSGGEYDRATLSILLALNTIFGSNILMLDESIASLDCDLTNEILEVMKDELSDRLIITVAHQINIGVFDNVIAI